MRVRSAKILGTTGEGEVEGGTFVFFAFGPDTAAVFYDDAVYDGEAYAGAFEIGCFVEALEYAEQLVCIVHAETGTVVAYVEYRFVVSLV